MTAISLNLPTAKSSDVPGLPLDGLPKLDPGGTLPQAFAELLGKAGKGAAGQGDAPTGVTPEGLTADGEVDASTIAAGVGGKISLELDGGEGAAPKAAVVPADGKVLPVEGTQIAAQPILIDAEAKGPKTKPDPLAEAENPQAPIAADAQALVPAVVLPGTADGKATVAGTEAATKVAAPVRAAGGTVASVQTAAQVSVQPDGQTSPGGQDMAGGEGGRRGEAQAEQAARSISRQIGAEATGTKGDTAKTGLSLQLRAADKPMAAPDTAQAGVLGNASSNASSGATAIAAAVPGAPALGTAVGAPGQPGAMPHFPELAALVDRIAAARDSAGSASATIALAHKELGNLSLTFETSGRSLNVEVAAQDSDTQRSLAAAIAADRPQFRGGEGQQQANTQGQAAQANLGANAQGGSEAGARQSGEAGDDRSNGRDRQRGDGNAQSGAPGQSTTDPKSDGGIYA